ncbi:MAG: exodeoxyribonuclease VII large subunit [Lachnospiraceae bacterium]|nr:exodeoxyribonuclease VII large subunit [Lachnospiraceae bacterium]
MKRNVYTVSQVNKYVGGLLAEDFLLHRIAVTGEVSNFKDHSSGHIYLTLKDNTAAINGVMWRSSRPKGLTFPLKNGDLVVASGEVRLYEKTGTAQLYIDKIEKAGEGDIYARIEALKKELEQMGMFDQMYKKPIPRYAKKVGIATAATGAAVRDIIQISRRRNPYVQLILCPTTVQGEEAAGSIVNSIRRLDSMGLDVIIIGRGGGSVEDLFAFNTEAVARAVFEAETPIVSAVGHQTDTTISDYVADLRAPTPSAAAELCVYDYYELMRNIDERRSRLSYLINKRIISKREEALYFEKMLSGHSPKSRLEKLRLLQKRYEESITRAMKLGITKKRNELAVLSERLEGLSPARKLSKGYAYVRDEKGNRISEAAQLEIGDRLSVSFLKGSVKAKIEEIEDGS